MTDRKKVLITGAASGIGRATAIRFAQEGYDVCANDIQKGKLKQLLRELPAGDHLSVPGSYSEEETSKIAEQQLRQWGRLDVLINCAGMGDKTDPIAMPLQRWKKVFDTMIDGSIRMTRLAGRFMIKGGRIVHISSIHGNHAAKYASSYAMAKAAINQLCRAMAVELAPKNILVNAIAPGFVDTPMSIVEGESELESAWFKQNYVQGHHLPLSRAARPEEIAGVAFFLAGKDASYITGQVITVDGGLTITF